MGLVRLGVVLNLSYRFGFWDECVGLGLMVMMDGWLDGWEGMWCFVYLIPVCWISGFGVGAWVFCLDV